MRSDSRLIAFVPTTDPDRAREFYEGKLGLKFLADDGFALLFDSNGTRLRVARVRDFTPGPGTALGWEVRDMDGALEDLARGGVSVERIPFLPQDDRGVCTFPNGDQVAWFKDPDGNTLSVARMASPAPG
jgi:catechol 2,3-dioxygenase-like lactoylglutathione lyase family enzyme